MRKRPILSLDIMPMHRISWKPEYEVGVQAIDEQHKQLFAMLDTLTRPDEEISLTEMVLQLGRYIETHFAFEEALMQKHAYPRMADHLLQHKDLMAQYHSMTDGMSGNDPLAVAKTRMVVYAWFTRHITSWGTAWTWTWAPTSAASACSWPRRSRPAV